MHELGDRLEDGEATEVTFLEDDVKSIAVIVKTFDHLTPEEMQTHRKDVRTKKFEDMNGLCKLGCYRRKRERDVRNTIDVKWVVKWKLTEEGRVIKVRMTVRGFKDRESWMETYAGTAPRGDQRIIDSISVLDPSWDEFSLDVGKAFAKGMTFAELSELTGQPMRAVEFQVNGEDL